MEQQESEVETAWWETTRAGAVVCRLTLDALLLDFDLVEDVSDLEGEVVEACHHGEDKESRGWVDVSAGTARRRAEGAGPHWIRIPGRQRQPPRP